MEGTSGIVDAHSHLRSISLADQGVTGSCLEEALLRMNAMTSVDPYDDALVASSDLLLKGITSVQFIFHTFGNSNVYFETLLRKIEGIKRSQIRARVVLAITDQYEFLPENCDSPPPLPGFVDVGQRMTPQEFKEVVDGARRLFPEIEFGIGPVAPQWCSDSMLEVISEIAESGLRVHTHFLESSSQRHWIAEGPLDRLERFGLLSERCSLAHSIWVTDDELDRVKHSGAQLVTCPRSNQLLRSGRAQIDRWIHKKIPFGVGLDSIGGIETPIGVARLALDESDALNALTKGGIQSTGLAADEDKVMWRNWDLGIVDDLFIGDQLVVSSGKLVKDEEVAEARQRISRTLESDSEMRKARQRELDLLIEAYLNSISIQ